MTRFSKKRKGIDFGEGTGSNEDMYSRGNEMGGIKVRDNQYRGVREGARNRKKKRAEKGYNKAIERQQQGKKLSNRQQRLMEEHEYNLGRQKELEAGRAGNRAVRKARKSKSLQPGAKTDANPVSAKQQSVLDQYGFDPKNTKADMPAVDVKAGDEVKKFNYQGNKSSGIKNPDHKGPTGGDYTNQQIQDMNSASFGKYDEYGVRKSYVKSKDGWKEQYSVKKGAGKAGREKMMSDYTEKFGSDAVFPMKEDGTPDYMSGYKNLRGLKG